MRPGIRRTVLTLAAAATLSATVLSTAGCGAFFVCQKATCPSSGTGTGTGTGSSSSDYVFVSNSSSGSTDMNGYVVSSGTLVAITGTPISLGYVPQSMATTPSAAYTNQYLYVVSQPNSACSTCGIYGFSIGTGGALTALNSGGLLLKENISSIDISSDGKWLFALDSNGLTISEYSINSSTGALTFQQQYTYGSQNTQNPIVAPKMIKVAPSGNFFVAALGTGGAVVYSFNTTTGVGSQSRSSDINPNVMYGSVNAVAIDENNYLYAAGTQLSGSKPGVLSYAVSSSGVLPSSAISSPAVGNGPIAVVVSTNNNFVYVANYADSTISAFSASSGTLTALNSGNAYSAPTNVSAMGQDSSGAYLLAAGYGTTGLQMFSISSSGLSAVANQSTAAASTITPVPVAIALTH